ncbi:MAG TPA: RND transporter [Syntrophobacteraceae bacterium]|nr:RND transporter [Syntrophobacteraceae bacterium]HBZ56239.1 RND transporter [Syntrophobacteraceae bacterium]
MNRFGKRIVLIGLLVVVVGCAVILFLRRGGTSAPSGFRAVAVKRGDLVASISATGAVEPEEVVDVGSQVAGKIVSFGKDLEGRSIDYGSRIEEGTVLAKIDDSLYAADVAQVQAQVEQAQALLQRSEADLGQLQAKLYQAERDWNRARKLGPSDALSQSDYDAALSGHQVAQANLAVGKAAITQAQASVAQAEANLRRAQQNLDYCTIKSPVKGVIIDRRVNIGQTVVASLNAPSLFLIAKDLRRMQVWVPVNEADIGSIHPGQPVSFTVDAFADEVFQGEVGKVRLNATMTQNVVTYTVEVITDNSSGKLLPYLTANAKFVVNERRDVLLAPNAALRYVPSAELIVARSGAKGGAGPVESGGTARQEARGGPGPGTLWVAQGDGVAPIPVQVGISDGSSSEVQGDGLKEGLQVVVGEQPKQESAPAPGGSPFTPRIFRGSGPPAGR